MLILSEGHSMSGRLTAPVAASNMLTSAKMENRMAAWRPCFGCRKRMVMFRRCFSLAREVHKMCECRKCYAVASTNGDCYLL